MIRTNLGGILTFFDGIPKIHTLYCCFMSCTRVNFPYVLTMRRLWISSMNNNSV